MLRLGIDIGSTTIKCVILDDENNIVYSNYMRHHSDIQETLGVHIDEIINAIGAADVCPTVTGSGGLSLSKYLGFPFLQEVIAVADAVKFKAPQTDVVVELGGEDAKIIYFDGENIEQRMNGICAGGTGAFIDQMAALLQTDATGLNEYAKSHESIYPIAARCGVFAKTDIQPLINEGASKEDLSASIFKAVVNQTISGLAQGKPIKGHVAFLGGPLHFLSELKASFIESLKLDDEHTIDLDNSHLFAALGSALHADANCTINLADLKEKLKNKIKLEVEVTRLDPLFKDESDYNAFKEKHAKSQVKRADITTYNGKMFLGIDAGSTTTKIAVVGENGELLWDFYAGNEGDPLRTSVRALLDLYKVIPKTATFARSCSTGYGEQLLKAGLKLDYGEVETIAHFTGAKFFDPAVDAIIDIGGQDMKCIRIKDGMVDSVQLNEACSSGCGSFIETFATSLGYSVTDFAAAATKGQNPIDLGTRCTVFMNSKVKQAQKEGAPVSDIAAGLAYSVIKNALYKVIKITKASDLGRNIVVQGGTFYNDAVLKAFEVITGGNVTRPDIAGIMGAFGAALIARDNYNMEMKTKAKSSKTPNIVNNIKDKVVSNEAVNNIKDKVTANGAVNSIINKISGTQNNDFTEESSIITLDELKEFTYETKMTRCQGCINHCSLTITTFPDKSRFITGNRCEKGLGKERANKDLPNLFDKKLELLFSYKSLTDEEATRGTIGIPRVLNMYENYPFWAVFFKKLGFKVVLSPKSTKKIYEMGISSIPSESECYPAKLVHGHVEWLLTQNIDAIFYPCIPYERCETAGADNHYNCPIVTSYAENIKNNVENLQDSNIKFFNPFISFESRESLYTGLKDLFEREYGVSADALKDAIRAGWNEQESFTLKVRKLGEEALQYMKDNKLHGIVLAGRPYHLDPEVNHGIPELLNSYKIVVLTEDSVAHLGKVKRPIGVLDQWMYHSRLYAAASFAATRNDVDLIQLNSFGCGLDAVTTDEVNDILKGTGKIYTLLKIDEISNLGAARIRIRSLLSAIKMKEADSKDSPIINKVKSTYNKVKVPFTTQMKEDGWTILCPQMSPIHFDFIEPAFRAAGYNLEILNNDTRSAVDMGLKYVNNDACYPSLIVVGQLMSAFLSGKYDKDKTALIISQTGGGCRASNYIGFIRRALEKSGYPNVPVISLNLSGLENNPGFKITPDLIFRGIYGCLIGDLLMRVLYATRPYETVSGSANKLYEKCKKRGIELVTSKHVTRSAFAKYCKAVVRAFDKLELNDAVKPKVGIVGEILVKYSPLANNHLVDQLEKEGAEVKAPDLLDFILYCFYNNKFKHDNYGMSGKTSFVSLKAIDFLEFLRKPMKQALLESKRFSAPSFIEEKAELASAVVSGGNQTGEGWFLTGEMLELIKEGIPNIVCTQPFGCLPNHIVGKGVIKKIRELHPESNIVAIDYDPGASEVNQLNRIKLMMTAAKRKLK